MLTEPTIEKLRALRMDVLAAAWTEQQKNPEMQKLSFDDTEVAGEALRALKTTA